MDIKTRFNVGDKFVEIDATNHIIKEKCEVCEGKGFVILNKTKYECPDCFGKGYHNNLCKKEWRVQKDEKTDMTFFNRPIGRIGVEVTGIRKQEIRIYYIRKNTGNMVYEENCFSNIEEAQAECDKRNREQR